MAIKLDITDIAASYGAVRALHSVSLNISQGQTVALLGTNGNGKSTLMKCVMGMVRPTQGSINLEIDGAHYDLTKLSTQEIVNLGVAMGVVPTKGLVLPFMSYGASAVMAHLICIGLLLNISGHQTPIPRGPTVYRATRKAEGL